MIVIGMAAAVLTQAIKVSPQAKVLAKPQDASAPEEGKHCHHHHKNGGYVASADKFKKSKRNSRKHRDHDSDSESSDEEFNLTETVNGHQVTDDCWSSKKHFKDHNDNCRHTDSNEQDREANQNWKKGAKRSSRKVSASPSRCDGADAKGDATAIEYRPDIVGGSNANARPFAIPAIVGGSN